MTPEEILFNLAECLCDQLAALPNPPATCCVVANDPVIPDCCPGFAWVRTTGSQPVPYAKENRCLPPYWAFGVELGVSRCAPETCGNLANPCCENEAAGALALMGDFGAMQRAVLCCLPGLPGGPALDQIAITNWAPDEPTGGCVTSRMLVAIKHANLCYC